MNHSVDNFATSSSFPGSSKRCVAPGIINIFFPRTSTPSPAYLTQSPLYPSRLPTKELAQQP